MQKLVLPLILLLLSACLSKENKVLNFYAAGDEAVSYHGRFDFENKKSPKTWAPGAYCTFSFKGKDCEVSILDEMKYFVTHNYISVIIDGGKPRRIQLKEVQNNIQIAKNLKNKVHHVLICKNTEAAIGYIQFTGIKCTKLIKKKFKKKKLIEFIGDSITCGNGSDTSQMAKNEGKWYDHHNAYLSYGPRVARTFKADWILSSVSGIGLTRSCCGTEYTMPDVYDKINFKPDGSPWTKKYPQPKLVCITLGQNDGLQKADVYISAYIAFVKKIRKNYPKASIVCCSSPMADLALQEYQKEHLPAIVKRLKQSGMKKIHYFCYKKNYRGGCLFHPTVQEHQAIAGELTAYLKKYKIL